MYKTIYAINIIIYMCLQHSKFEITVYLPLRERICSPKEFAPLRIFCKFIFTKKTSCLFLLELYRRTRMYMNFPATTRDFFYKKYWRNFKKFMELLLACHRTFGIFLTRNGI